MKKIMTKIILLASLFLIACTPNVNPSLQKEAEAFVQSVTGNTDITISLETDTKASSFRELLENNNPVLLSLSKTDSCTPEEIDTILHQFQKTGYSLKLCFDNDDTCIYLITPEHIQMDITTPKDGGSMHNIQDYTYGD